MSTKKTSLFNKIRSNRIKYLKLFPLFIDEVDRVKQDEDNWPCFNAKMIDNLVMIPDVEQGDKLFRYGSFGKCEFIRTATSVLPSMPLETVPNNQQKYEKPFRLRSIDPSQEQEMEANIECSEFELAFLEEFHQKMFAPSIEHVRQKNQRECQQFLDRTRIYPIDHSSNTPTIVASDNTEENPAAKLIIYERVHLLPEETIFLQHALGCLTVEGDNNHIFTPDELWNKFSASDRYFPTKYAVYYHFRSAGWVVKCGLKFGCDYMLYRFGPAFNHADYCVSIRNFWRTNSCSWSFLAGLNRACLNAAKTLLLTTVDLHVEPSNNIEQFLEQIQVKTIEVNRWIPTQHRSSTQGIARDDKTLEEFK